MRFSDERISYLAHLLCEHSSKQGLIKIPDMNRLLNETKQVLQTYCKLDETVDEFVRKKLGSHSRMILEGSPEWDVMYKKYFQEEMNKHWK